MTQPRSSGCAITACTAKGSGRGFSSFSTACLRRKPGSPRPAPSCCVAFSGGLDSTVLLHALARAIADRANYRMRAAHVDHQLHPDSASWREQCGRVAQSLQIEFVPLVVTVASDPELSPEAAARDARYAALRQILKPNEVLLTAHHADDQLETMLLALMRGAGLRGLSGVPSVQIFGGGWLARPLLEFSRAELEEWARAERLQWLEDPSNAEHALRSQLPAPSRAAGAARALAGRGSQRDSLDRASARSEPAARRARRRRSAKPSRSVPASACRSSRAWRPRAGATCCVTGFASRACARPRRASSRRSSAIC